MGNNVTISVERFQQLVREEQDAMHLKALIADAYENYETIDRAKLALLYKVYIGKKEDSEE